MSLNNGNNRGGASISILGGMRDRMEGTTTGGRADREPSEFWANIGFTIKGGGENGEDLFVSLPSGLALDDMKVTPVRGNKPSWIHLAQAKNHLLEQLKTAAGKLDPGQGLIVEDLSVQIYRKGAPEQVGTSESNPLIAAISGGLRG